VHRIQLDRLEALFLSRTMILPIYAYGSGVLRKKAVPVPIDYPDLEVLIANMFETMYGAKGVGLAAPQIGLEIRLFVVDAEPMDEESLKGFKRVFINPILLEESGPKWAYEEGCLSIPGINDDVERHSNIKLEYEDEHRVRHVADFDGMAARVIQHEYDHLEGVLFTDYATPLRKRLQKSKLADISKGDCDARYRMRFPIR
jgi:peptide deformylase